MKGVFKRKNKMTFSREKMVFSREKTTLFCEKVVFSGGKS
jgi:hypothetical protein